MTKICPGLYSFGENGPNDVIGEIHQRMKVGKGRDKG